MKPFMWWCTHYTLIQRLIPSRWAACRSLFIVLDSLSFWDDSASAVGRAWLNQVLQRHDIARVLEPLLLLLLHPKTHRVSIQRVQAQRHWTWTFPDPPALKPGSEPPEAGCLGDSGCSGRKFNEVLLLVLLLCL